MYLEMQVWSRYSRRVEHSWPDWGRRSLVSPLPKTTGEPPEWEEMEMSKKQVLGVSLRCPIISAGWRTALSSKELH